MEASANIHEHDYRITLRERSMLLTQRPALLWFTGLSGSGKSTIADMTEQWLHSQGYKTYLLDGDNIRHGLNSNLDFSEEGRKENIRRIGEVARLFMDAGIIVLTAFISPFREDRDRVRTRINQGPFIEIFVDCPIQICEQRDVKGLYAKARSGAITDFTGIHSPYEAPLHPEITIHSDKESIESSVRKITDYCKPLIQYPIK